MTTTITEVARIAGVSISTVSHVVNGTRHVEPATRKRVLDAVAKTGYRKDALARAMRRSRTDSIGLVVSDAGEPAFAEMVHGVEHAAAKLGLTLLLANSAEDADREAQAVEALLERRVDGVILARAAGSHPSVIEDMARESTPLVLMDRLMDEPFDQVGAQNIEPMRELVAHLAQLGHTSLALVAGDTRVPTLRERNEGFARAVRESGLDPHRQAVVTGPLGSGTIPRQLSRTLDGQRPPSAYIACSTVLAVATMTEFKKRSMAIPDDVAFATFDGFAHSDLFEPQITTVRQPAFEVGVAAVQLLNERLSHSGGEPKTVRLPQTIEYRGSTQALR